MFVSNINTRKIHPNDESSLEVLVKNYVEEEPVCKHLQLSDRDKHAYVQAHLQFALESEVSVGSFVKDTGEMCGFSISSLPQSRSESNSSQDCYAPYEDISMKLQILSRFDDIMETGVADFIGSKNYMLMEMAYVLPQYQKRNISKDMRQMNHNSGLEHNCDALAVVAVSEYIARSFMKDGFLPVKAMNYDDYIDPVTGEAVFRGLESNHKCCTLLIKLLKFNKSKL